MVLLLLLGPVASVDQQHGGSEKAFQELFREKGGERATTKRSDMPPCKGQCFAITEA